MGAGGGAEISEEGHVMCLTVSAEKEGTNVLVT